MRESHLEMASVAKGDDQISGKPLLLTRKELALFVGLSEKKAMELLAQHGVQPIDLGRGRGNGLRWRTTAVIEVVDILHTEAQARRQASKVRKTSRQFSVRGKTAEQLFAEFNGDIHTRAEVCNGD